MSDFLRKLIQPTQQPTSEVSVAQVTPTTETLEPVAEVPQEPKKEAVIEPPTAPPPAPAPTPVAPVVPKDNNKQELERRRRRLMGY